MIRRSDDHLMYDCTTEDGRIATGYIQSEIEGGKMAASVIFLDLGITDAITDKHRTYQSDIVIPILRGAILGKEPEPTQELEPAEEWE
jgi:hypothetical protein